MKFRALLLLLVVFVATGFTACKTGALTTQSQRISAACATIAAAEDTLTIANSHGKLSPAQVAAVNKAIAVKQPVCNVTPQPTLSNVAFAALETAVAEISAQAAAVKSP